MATVIKIVELMGVSETSFDDAVRQAVSEVYRPRLFSDRTRTLVRWIRWLLG